MPRDLSVTIDAALEQDHTEPGFLIYIDMAPPLRLSTVGEVPWNGQTWEKSGALVDVNSIMGDNAIFSQSNDDNSASSLVLNSLLRDAKVIIYQIYDQDAGEVWRGYISESKIDEASMRVTHFCEASRSSHAKFPRQRISAPVFTHLPRPGTEIKWANTVIKVES